MIAELENALRFAVLGAVAIAVALAVATATPVTYGSPNISWKEPIERMEFVAFAPSVTVGVK